MKRVSPFQICYILMKSLKINAFFPLVSASTFVKTSELTEVSVLLTCCYVHSNHAQWQLIINALNASYLTFMVGCGI